MKRCGISKPSAAFYRKVIFYVLDKLFIGVLAAVVVIYVQHKLNLQEEWISSATAACSFESQILKEQRNEFSKAFGEFIYILDDVKDKERPDDVHKIKTKDLERRIKQSIRSTYFIDENIESDCKKFLTTLEHAAGAILEKKNPGHDLLKKYIQDLQDLQKAVIESFSKTTKKKMRDEFEDVKKDYPAIFGGWLRWLR